MIRNICYCNLQHYVDWIIWQIILYFLCEFTALCGLRNLRMLDLHYNDLSNGTLPACLLHEHSSLETLDLYDCNLVEDSRGVLTGMRKREILSINIPASTVKIFVALQKQSLISLTVYLFAALSGARNLKNLNLSDNNLNDESMRLCSLYNLSSLESLNLAYNDIEGSSNFLTGMRQKIQIYLLFAV